ncbi:MAG: rod shape-determining protein RodA [Prevotella sp.]|jgi:rod shape determining protein RodA|nr:rod shape-determining protein RodA [Prevotella sp.]
MRKKIDDNIAASVDWIIVLLYIVLVVCGWLNIYGASYEYDSAKEVYDLSTRAGTQLLWIGTSMILAFVLLKLDSNIYDITAYFTYVFFVLLLIVTIFVAPSIKGSRSWLVITNSIRLQPAEFAKVAVALALARFMNSYNFKLITLRNLLIITALIVFPILLIFAQKETGSALVYLAFVLALYREGLPGIVLLLGVCAIVLFVIGLKYSEVSAGLISLGEFISAIIVMLVAAGMVAGFKRNIKIAGGIVAAISVVFAGAYIVSRLQIHVDWGLLVIGLTGILVALFIFLSVKYLSRTYLFIALFVVCGIVYTTSVNYVFSDILQPHQQMRIKVSLGMEEDIKGAGYNVNQSKIAIGSGGFWGKGLLNGTQTKLKYVPEQDTDFIFCTVGEEHGFFGSTLVLILFLILILRLIYLSERQQNTFGRVYGYCVASIFLFHLTINVGMVVGLLPVIGIPLPFFSYGGSSLWGFTILLFIFLRIDMYRKRR